MIARSRCCCARARARDCSLARALRRSCRVKPDASNVVTPAVLLASLVTAGIGYPPPAPPPSSPPVDPPSPSPPPGELRCELSAISTTTDHKTLEIDADGAPSLVNEKCWRWDIGNDWPPFVAHRDLYTPVAECGGERSRDIQWGGGYKQSLMSAAAYDPQQQNNDECPYDDRFFRLDASVETVDAGIATGDGQYCLDGTGVSSAVPTVCELGTNARNCGIHRNLVVFGYAYVDLWDGSSSSFKKCVSTSSYAVVNNYLDKSICQDGGAGSTTKRIVDRVYPNDRCIYGTDGHQCGTRRFAFLPEQAGPDEPDDSCASAGNTICEDGLMWSVDAPGSNPCAPNTDLCASQLAFCTCARAQHGPVRQLAFCTCARAQHGPVRQLAFCTCARKLLHMRAQQPAAHARARA